MSIKSHRPDAAGSARWTRRGFVGASVSLPLLAACSSDPHSDASDLLKMFGQSVDAFGGDPGITRDQAATVPYASIGVRVGDSPQVLLVLAVQNRGTCLWTSDAHIAFETQSGRITKTAGLPHNMSQTDFGGRDPLQTSPSSGNAVCEYVLDLPDRNIYGAPVEYEMDGPEHDEIVILGARLKLLHSRERGMCPLLDWRFVNEYWIDPAGGFVWRSRQSIHPDLDTVEITALRPPG